MAQVLGPGEELRAGQSRFDETGRFEVVMQRDHNLVVYAYVIEPQVAKVPLGATNTDSPNITDDFGVKLTSAGALLFFQPSTGNALQRVDGIGGGPDDEHPGSPLHPGSTLHLFGGRLALFRPGGFTPEFVTFAIGGASEATERVSVMPGKLMINVLDGNLDPAAQAVVTNTTADVVGIRDGRAFQVLQPNGGRAAVAAPAGRIVLESALYGYTKGDLSVPVPGEQPGNATVGARAAGMKTAFDTNTFQPGDRIDIFGSEDAGFHFR